MQNTRGTLVSEGRPWIIALGAIVLCGGVLSNGRAVGHAAVQTTARLGLHAVSATPGPVDVVRRLALARDPRTERALRLWKLERHYVQAAALLAQIRETRRKRFGIDDGEVLRLLLQLYRDAGDGRNELRASREILGPHPGWGSTSQNDPRFLKRYAGLAERYGNEREAAETYQRILIRFPVADPTVCPSLDRGIGSFQTLKARALATEVDWTQPQGLRELRQAVAVDPTDPIVRYHLAWSLQQARHLRSARIEYQRIAQGSPDAALAARVAEQLHYLASFRPDDLDKWDRGPA